MVAHVICQLLVSYPAALRDLVPELWWNLLAVRSIGLLVLALLAPVLLARDGLNLADIGFAPTRWTRDIRRGILAGSGIALLHFALLKLAMVWTAGASVNTGMTSVVSPMSGGVVDVAGVLFGVVILAPVIEEVLYRGCLMASTRSCLGGRAWTAVLAAILSAIVFALVHAVGHPVYSAVYFVTGLAFALVYQITGSLTVSIFAHGTVNAFGAAYMIFRIWRG